MGRGAVGIQQGMRALMSSWSQGHTMENAQQAGGGGAGDRSVCKAAVRWGLYFAGGSSLNSSLVHFKAIYQGGYGRRPVCPLMPHFIVGETEAQGKEVTDSPSKAFPGIRHMVQRMPASCADRSELQGAQHFCKPVLPVEDHINPAWSPP